jgi:VanZ family protein
MSRLFRSFVSKFCLSAFVLWIVALYILSSIPKGLPPSIPMIIHPDKIVHFAYFFAGAFCLTIYTLLKQSRFSHQQRLFGLLILFVVIGAADEFHQSFTPGRSGNDPWDLLADVIGASIGILIANTVRKIFRKQSLRVPMSACDQDPHQ